MKKILVNVLYKRTTPVGDIITLLQAGGYRKTFVYILQQREASRVGLGVGKLTDEHEMFYYAALVKEQI